MFEQSLSPASQDPASRIERLPRKPPHSIVATYLEHADDGIMPVDAMGRIAVCTGKAASLLDLSSASAVLGRLAGSR